MIEATRDKFYLQSVNVSDRFAKRDRLDVFRDFCDGKRVLHIGCAGYPRTDPATSLHLKLARFCNQLDGYDTQIECYDILRGHVHNGMFLNSLAEARQYDVVLIPEVLEHVGSPEKFLADMAKIDSSRYVITVPDLFQCFARNFELRSSDEMFFEVVHPDHNCWYSPYTITNTIKKYTSWRINKVYWFNRISLLVDCSR